MPITAQEFKEAAAKRRKTTTVDVEGLGTVRLRALSAGDALLFRAKAKALGESSDDVAFPMIARSWVGDDGELLFPEAEGVEVAKSLDLGTFTAIVSAVLKLNGLDEKAVDDALKNSETSRDAPTPTGSPESTTGPTLI